MKKTNKKKILSTNRNKKYLYLSFIVLCLVAFGAIGAFLLNNSKAVASDYTLVKTEDFNINTKNIDATADWDEIDNEIMTRSLAIYKEENSEFINGSLVLKTRRHCVDSAIKLQYLKINPKTGKDELYTDKILIEQNINDSTATTAVCPTGKTAYYSSGKVDSKFRVPAGRVEIRAQIPALQKGYFSGFWLRNESPWPATGQSSPYYGELDISEIYGHSPTDATATSHISVFSDGLTSDMHHVFKHPSTSPIYTDKGGWHDFAIEWDETGIVYYYDGNKMDLQGGDEKTTDTDYFKDTYLDFKNDEHSSAKNITEQQFKDIMNQMWKTLLEVQVNKSTPPDNTQVFNVMETKIDWIKYYEKSSSVTPSKLATPTNLVTTPADGKVTLNWTAVANADNYTVRWGQNGVWNYSNGTVGSTNPTNTTYTITGLTNGQSYEFQVGARDSTGAFDSGDFSASVVAVPNIQVTKLPAPTNITATPADGKVTLNWPAVANANYYTVRWGQNGVWNYSNSPGPDITGTSYTVSGLTNGQSYEFQVGARVEAGSSLNSDFSASVVAVPKIGKQSDFNGSGKVDVFDLSNLLSSWNSSNITYDINKNGKVDVFDLSILLSEWG